LLHVDTARLSAPRVDVPGRTVALDEITIAGVDAEARQAADGSLHLLGLRTVAATTVPAPVVAENPQQTTVVVANAPPPTTGPTDVSAIVAARRSILPLITLEKLNIDLRRLALVNESQTNAEPLALCDLKLRNLKRIELLGENPSANPPIELDLSGRIDPLVKNLAVKTIAAPLAPQATLDIDVTVTGISGEGLTRILPELANQLDGKSLSDGRFAMKLEGSARFEKKSPTEPDFTKPFDAAFQLRDVAFRNGDDPAILAGVEEVRAEAIRMNPANGNVVVRALEVSRPQGRVLRDAEGIHVLGLVIKTPAPTTAPTTGPSERGVVVVAEAPPAPAQKPASEIRIDKLVVSGIDFLVEDHTAEPGLIVPLNTLEFEARDLSNLVMFENRPVRFNIIAGTGKVPLAGGRQSTLFSEFAANGQLALHPQPTGYVHSALSGFELVALTGYAKQNKVELGGGVLDNTLDLRLPGDGSIDARTRTSFTDLKISEPPEGPIRKNLKLPAPLETVILVLQDQNGTITAPLHVPIKQGEIGTGVVAASAVGAFGQIVTTAIASSPLKVTGTVTSMLGMKKEPGGAQPATGVDFASGADESMQLTGNLEPLLAQLRRNARMQVTLHHELGRDDVARCARLANPSPGEAAVLAARLRERKLLLQSLRRDAVARAGAVLASSIEPDTIAHAVRPLRVIDRELANTEESLDGLYDLLRPGAERQADRRTRAACIALGEARLDAVRDSLLAAAEKTPTEFPNLSERIKLARPQAAAAVDTGQGRVVAVIMPRHK
jgi:hypothetical protein